MDFKPDIGKKKILIADPSPAARRALAGAICKMGAEMPFIRFASNYPDAELEIQNFKPDILLTEFEIGFHCSLDLLTLFRKFSGAGEKSLCVIISKNSSQAAVAEAVEEDVDGYLVKPFNYLYFEKVVTEAYSRKHCPSDYYQIIEKGKKELKDQHYEEALKLFESASRYSSKPSLVCFYQGKAHLGLSKKEDAQGDYEKGLEFNRIHYLCSVGLFDLMMEEKNFQTAYEVGQKITKLFPANPSRLKSLLYLAIYNHKYEDILEYHKIFTHLDVRTEELCKNMASALCVTGKYYLSKEDGSSAKYAFKHAAILSQNRSRILKYIIFEYMNCGHYKVAIEFLRRYRPLDRSSQSYRSLSLYLEFKLGLVTKKEFGKYIEESRIRIQNSEEDPLVYAVLIEALVESGYLEKALKFFEYAQKRFKEVEDSFDRVSLNFLQALGPRVHLDSQGMNNAS